MAMIWIVVIATFSATVSGSLYHGGTFKLSGNQDVNQSDYKLSSWTAPAQAEQLHYKQGIDVQSQKIKTTIEGIFFYSTNIYIGNADLSDKFQLNVEVDKNNVFTSIKYARSNSLTLQVAGFFYAREDTVVEVSVLSQNNYTIFSTTSFSLHYYGSLSSSEGVLAQLQEDVTDSNKTKERWSYIGDTGMFNVGNGFSSDGVFIASDEGIFMIYANLMISSPLNTTVTVYVKINATKYEITTQNSTSNIISVLINTVFKLTSGSKIMVGIDHGSYKLHKDSTLSIFNIGKSSTFNTDYAQEIRTDLLSSQDKNMKQILLLLYEHDSIKRLNQTSNFDTFNGSDIEGLICKPGSYYHLDVSLKLATTAKNELHVLEFVVGANKLRAVENIENNGLLTLSSTFKCEKNKVMQLKYSVSNSSITSFSAGSTFSLIEIRYIYPKSLSLKAVPQAVVFDGINTTRAVDNFELTNGQQYDLSSSFQQNCIIIPIQGIYYLAANIFVEGNSSHSFSICVTVNNNCTKHSGMFSTAHNSRSVMLSTNQLLQKNDVLKLTVMCNTSTTWNLLKGSGFFVLFLGKYHSVPVYSAYTDDPKLNEILSQPLSMNSTNFESGNWKFGNTLNTPQKGSYIVTCSITISLTNETTPIDYTISIRKKDIVNNVISFDTLSIKEASTFTLTASSIYFLSVNDQLTCHVEQTIRQSINALHATFSAALLNTNKEGFVAYLNSENIISPDSANNWEVVNGVVTSPFPGFKSAQTIFNPTNGEFSPSKEDLVLALGAIKISNINNNFIGEGAFKNDDKDATDLIGISSRMSGPGMISFSGLIQVTSVDNWQLVVRNVNDKSFYTAEKGSGWALSSVDGINVKSAVLLYANDTSENLFTKSEPYPSRELTIDQSKNTFYTESDGYYMLYKTIKITNADTPTRSMILQSSNAVVNSTIQEKGIHGHGLITLCLVACTVDGLTVSQDSDIHSFAVVKVAGYPATNLLQKVVLNPLTKGLSNLTYQMKQPEKDGLYLVDITMNTMGIGNYTIFLGSMEKSIQIFSYDAAPDVVSYTTILALTANTNYMFSSMSETDNITFLTGTFFGMINYMNNLEVTHYESEFNTSTSLPLISNVYQYLSVVNSSGSGATFTSICSGTYLVTANVFFAAKMKRTITFTVAFENKFGLPGLTSEREYESGENGMLNIAVPIHMKENRYIGVALKSNVSGDVKITNLKFTVSSIELDRESCKSKKGQWLLPVSPNSVVVAETNNVTIKCITRQEFRADYFWYYQGKIIFKDYGKLLSSLIIRNITVDQAGQYTCQIRRNNFDESSNVVNITVIGLYPAVSPNNSVSFIDENVNVKTVLKLFSSFAFISTDIEKYAYLNATIQDDHNGAFGISFTNVSNGFYEFELFAVKPFDYETRKKYDLKISFVNVNSTTQTMSIKTIVNATVYINNVNESPSFIGYPYNFTLYENASIGDFVGVVSAKDDGNFSFQFLNGSAESVFRINETGYITLNKSVDREVQDFYTLFVRVSDEDFKQYHEVTVKILDVNDNIPKFTKRVYNIEISEAIIIGREILKLEFADPDLNPKLVFRISQSNATNGSFLVTNDGVLKTNTSFYPKEIELIQLQIVLEEDNQQSNGAEVNIKIIDLNDNNPVFDLSVYSVTIKENVTGPVLNVSATDKDFLKKNSQIIYFVDDDKFSIHPNSGLLTLNQNLDFEIVHNYSLFVFARDNTSLQRVGKAKVVVEITDINDNSPVFTTSNYTTVLENMPISNIIFKVSASDMDSGDNGKVVYSLEQADSIFNINSQTGKITINKNFDYESIKRYNLTIKAADSNKNGNIRETLQNIIINIKNINEHYPVFSEVVYMFNIPENEPPVTQIGCVFANDSDSDEVVFSIHDTFRSLESMFLINSSTGCIESKISFDREKKDVYNFNIEARDNATIALSDISRVVVSIMDKNDETPTFQPNTVLLNISEGINIGRQVYQLSATDSDDGSNGDVNYVIIAGNKNNHFSIDASNQLFVNRELDRENITGYNLTVKASDRASSPKSSNLTVTIRILDNNDNQPYFTKDLYAVSIQENVANNTVVISVKANDADAKVTVTYSIEKTADAEYFYVDILNGSIYTKKNIDYEIQKSFWIVIIATDNDIFKGKTVVHISVEDKDDSLPEFAVLGKNISIALKTPVGREIIAVNATDADSGSNAVIEYSILNANKFFSINNSTGVVSLVKPIKSYDPQTFSLIIRASPKIAINKRRRRQVDKSAFLLTISVIHPVDNNPVFNNPSYKTIINENVAVGTSILKINATTALMSSLSYSIMKPFQSFPFTINTTTGDIETSKTIDYELNEKFEFYVKAEVVNESSEATSVFVQIAINNLNDNPPVFLLPVVAVNISEYAPVGLQIAQVVATDNDKPVFKKVEYKFLTNPDDNAFALDSSTGIISVNETLDFEKKTNYSFVVYASNLMPSPLNSTNTAVVNIFVHNVNDNQPYFDRKYYEKTIAEDTLIGTSVISVTVNSRDQLSKKVNYNIVNATNVPFSIQANGTIVTTKMLDRESNDSYNFQVEVIDQQKLFTSRVSIYIVISDVNDNTPYFVQQNFTVNISESALPGEIIALLTIVDNDVGSNGDINFTMISGVFAIKTVKKTVTVYLLKELDYETTKNYILTLSAQDSGTPSRSVVDSAFIHVLVQDENDNSPQFLKDFYDFKVFENVPLSVSVKAMDFDTISSIIVYKILPTNNSHLFSINAMTGDITKNVSTPQLLINHLYTLTVIASDNGTPPRTTQVTVYIFVNEINQFKPVFAKQLYNFNIRENLPVDTFVGQITATDNDNSTIHKLTYSISFGNLKSLFTLDNNGNIRTNSSIDYETDKSFTLVIQVEDNGVPSKKADQILSVFVIIIDENDNTPKFQNNLMTFNISESTAISTSVYKVLVSDDDFGSNAKPIFKLLTAPTNPFLINEIDGSITLAKSLDYAKASQYVFYALVSDSGVPKRKAVSKVIANITNVNYPPVFKLSNATIDIIETFNVNKQITYFVPKYDKPLDLIYSFQFDNSSSQFRLEGNRLYLNGSLDYEKEKFFLLRIKATDKFNSALFDEISLFVNVININDIKPLFNSKRYEVSTKENSPIGTVVIDMSASDNDSLGIMTYSLHQLHSYFTINVTTGIITVRNEIDYDALAVKSIPLIVEATDSVPPYLSTAVQVIVNIEDVNDNKPTFANISYVKTIPLNTPIGSFIFALSVTDADSDSNGKLIYDIQEAAAQAFFTILDNYVMTIKSVNLISGYMNFTVQVSDGIFQSSQALEIYISNVTDKFQFSKDIFNVSVPESIKPTKTVFKPTLIASNATSSIIYSIEYAHPSGLLTLNTSTSEISLKLNKKLDYFHVKSIVLQISARDSTHQTVCTVVVNVIDTNNNKPVFDQQRYEVSIPKSSPLGSFVAKVYAKDKDVVVGNNITYSFLTNQHPFQISNDGVVTLKSSLALENPTEYVLKINASDNGSPLLSAETVLVINVTTISDITPTFTKAIYDVEIPENIPLSSQIFNFQQNLNPLKNTLILCTAQSNENVVNVSGDNILSRIKLDYESKKNYLIQLKCVNQNFTYLYDTAALNLKITDLKDDVPGPIINATRNVTLSELAPVGTCVELINGLSNYTYNITSGNSENKFAITVQGKLKTLGKLDYETTRQYKLIVLVHDLNNFLYSNVTVDIKLIDENEFSPSFQYKQYNLSLNENQTLYQTLLTANAMDIDDFGSLKYRLSNENYFYINPLTGAIQLNKSLDFETQELHILTIFSTDNGKHPRSGFADLVVKVLDINDNTPNFNHPRNIDISEFIPVNTDIYTIYAADRDDKNNSKLQYSITSGNTNSEFAINSNGTLTTIKKMNFELVSEFSLVIQVSDSGSPPHSFSSMLNISIIDENEFAPVFSKRHHKINISESTATGTNLLDLNATDFDSFGKIVYALEGDYNDMFEINNLTGVVLLQKQFDYEQIKSYRVVVTAVDSHPDVPRKGYCEFTVNVQDVNDNAPIIANGATSATVRELTPIGTLIYSIKASDADDGNNKLLNYIITPSVFNISSNGEITLNKLLDYENVKSYHLNITIQDQGRPMMWSETYLNISVINENEHAPVFSPKQYNVSFAESTSLSSSIIKVQATDSDDFGKITYYLKSHTDMFSINKTTGIISLIKTFDYETTKLYEVQVSGKDGGAPVQMEGCAVVYVHVTDVNDNSPIILNSNLTFNISEFVPIHTIVYAIQVSDADSNENSKLSYRILKGNDQLKFSVNNIGQVITEKSLDFESVHEYNLFINIVDHGVPSLSVNLTLIMQIIDGTEFAAKFSIAEFIVNLPESKPIGTELIDINGTYAMESKNVSFSIEDSFSDTFALNKSSGLLSLRKKVDFELRKVYYVMVIVTGNNLTDSIKGYFRVVVNVQDVNDNAPAISNGAISVYVSELNPIGTLIYSIKASDADDGNNKLLNYLITPSVFNISSNGEIILNTLLEYENVKSYNLNITVQDQGSPMMWSETYLNISVINENEHAPVFSQKQYNVSFAESTSLSSSIIKIQATDADDFGKITYYLKSHTDMFSINKTTGIISLIKIFDYETTKLYEVQVSAKDGGAPVQMEGCAIVYIYVTDVNDNTPTTSKGTFSEYVNENVAVNDVLLQINALDADSDDNSKLNFTIMSGDTNNQFDITNSGVMSVAKQLDYESEQMYNLTVRISDSPVANPRYTDISVIIYVVDVNEHNPKFNGVYSAKIDENLANGTNVVKLKATDADIKDVLTFDLNHASFGIDKTNGQIITTSTFDFETKSVYQLVVTATDNGTTPRQTKTVVTVTIKDVNDNAPVISNGATSVDVSELTAIGTLIYSIKATDADDGNNQLLNYFVMPSVFNISSNGEITLNTLLDYENVKSYHLNITVQDQGNPMMWSETYLNISVINENEHAPVFSQKQYNVSFAESTSLSSSIIKVQATDADDFGKITYYLKSHTDMFSINKTTGIISLIKIFDYETTKLYEVQVSAKDGGAPVQMEGCAVVYIYVTDVNDNTPTTSKRTFSEYVNENVAVNDVLLRINALDADSKNNSKLEFAIMSGDTNNQFDITNSGVMSVAKQLDYESEKMYNLTVRISDSPVANPRYTDISVIIYVVDVNEHNPKFNGVYSAKIDENLANGTNVVKLKATDADIKDVLTFNLNHTSFGIDKTNGQIITTSTFDFETKSVYQLIVTATDNGTTPRKTKTVVTVSIKDVNDNAPAISNGAISVYVSELNPIGTLIYSIKVSDADDGNNKLLNYLITPSVFNISSNGEIILNTLLDYENVKSYNLNITVQDQGSPMMWSETYLNISVINENEHAPVFSPKQYNVSFAESTSLSSSIIKVQATDADDFGKITYYLKSHTDMFSINKTTGIISLIKIFDYETTKLYEVQVSAKDGGDPVQMEGCAVVYIYVTDVNDNTPTTSKRTFSEYVNENVAVNDVLLRINALDADSKNNSKLEFAIMSGDTNNQFDITNSGVMSVAKQLDYESEKMYNLTVRISDSPVANPRYTDISVIIYVVDVNEHNPKFNGVYSAKIDENLANGTNVVKLKATDADTKDVLSFALNHASFSIDNTTAQIITTSAFDFETKSVYQLVVTATDNGTTPRQTKTFVTVTIKDVNDNAPVISNGATSVDVSELTAIGTLIYSIKATDADNGNNQLLNYFVMPSVFNISSNGEITLNTLLDYENVKSYHLNITVQDQGSPMMWSETYLNISVINENEHAPVFSQKQYNVSFAESTSLSSSIIKVQATDADDFGKITYYLKSHTDMFSINKTTGIISLIKIFDYETSKLYKVQVSAKDGGAPVQMEGCAVVYIYVTDVNDNTPTTSKRAFSEYVNENVAVNDVLLQINALDADSNDNSKLNFTIMAGDTNNQFDITNSGVLSVSKQLDYEIEKMYNLTLRISDSPVANPRHTDVSVIIYVLDVNEHNPKFKGVYNAKIDESVKVGTNVIKLEATDADTKDVLTFDLNHKSFSIDNATGQIITTSTFDFETKSVYQLVVTVTDNGTAPRIAQTVFTVTINDVNDNAPKFSIVDTTNITLTGSIKVNSTIHKITGVDLDSDQKMSFTLIAKENQNTVNLFQMVQTSPTTASILNKEVIHDNKFYSLNITVTDAGGLFSTKKVNLVFQRTAQLNALMIQSNTSIVELEINLADSIPDYKNRTSFKIIGQQIHEASAEFDAQTALAPVGYNQAFSGIKRDSMRRFVVLLYTKSKSRKRRDVTSLSDATGLLKLNIGTQQSCAASVGDTPCNGPLTPGTRYRFQVLAEGDKLQPVLSPFTAPFSTNPSILYESSNTEKVVVIAVIALTVTSLLFFLALVAIAFLLCERRSTWNMMVEKERMLLDTNVNVQLAPNIALPKTDGDFELVRNYSVLKDKEEQPPVLMYYNNEKKQTFVQEQDQEETTKRPSLHVYQTNSYENGSEAGPLQYLNSVIENEENPAPNESAFSSQQVRIEVQRSDPSVYVVRPTSQNSGTSVPDIPSRQATNVTIIPSTRTVEIVSRDTHDDRDYPGIEDMVTSQPAVAVESLQPLTRI